MNMQKEKIQRIINECEKHLLRMNSAYLKMKSYFPLDKEKYVHLSDDEVEHIDQFLFRFAKLQDSVGDKLFKTLLLYLEEKIENKPFLDILNRLEKLEIIENASTWIILRNIRNELSHNYDDEPDEMSIAINKVYENKEVLESIFNKTVAYYKGL